MIQETQEAVVDYCRSDRSLYRHLLSMNDDRFKRSVHDECSTITIHVYRLKVLLHAFSKAVDLREFKMRRPLRTGLCLFIINGHP